jgi:hypothetical protein
VIAAGAEPGAASASPPITRHSNVDVEEQRWTQLEADVAELDRHLVVDRFKRHVACSICEADPGNSIKVFCVALPTPLDTCADVMNRCKSHVHCERHRRRAGADKTQSTLPYVAAEPDAQNR